MAKISAFTFIYSTGAAYVSVETDSSKNLVKVGCLGMGPEWEVADFTWDFNLDDDVLCKFERIESLSRFHEWDECYIAADVPDLEWQFNVVYSDGSSKKSFGQGMRPECLEDALALVYTFVSEIYPLIHIDYTDLEAVYFRHLAHGSMLTSTLYRDMESSVEYTHCSDFVITLTAEQWAKIKNLISTSKIPHFGFCKSRGKEFVSLALYLGGRMVSFTCAGAASSVWDKFEEDFLSIVKP